MNDVLLTTGSWTSGVVINLDVNLLAVGIHNFTIVVSDVSGNFAVDTVIVTVTEDTTDPVINSPDNITYAEGLSGIDITWIATDLYEDNFTISRNGTQVHSDNWDTGVAINFNVDGLAAGVYIFEIEVFDLSGNSATDSVTVTVTGSDTTGEPKDDDGNGVIIVVVAVLALGAAGAGVFVYMKKK